MSDFTDLYDDDLDGVECKRCGAQRLHWHETIHGYRLHDEDCRVHYCPPAGFDDEEED